MRYLHAAMKLKKNTSPVAVLLMSKRRLLQILDGGTGELLFRKGRVDDRVSWSAKAIVEEKYHCLVSECHLNFLNAGSKIITTNNYGITPRLLEFIPNLNIAKSVSVTVDLANTARETFYEQNKNINDTILIAGCLPPLNESYRPDQLFPDNKCEYWYNIIANTLNDKGIDIFLCETMSGIKECEFALKAIQKLKINQKQKCWISFTLNDKGLTRANESINDVIHNLQQYFMCNNVEIISMNCCMPESIDIALENINDKSINILNEYGIQIGCYANANTYHNDQWEMSENEPAKVRDILTPKYYYEMFVKKWLKKYSFIGMIGGCCHVFPEHIQYCVQHIIKDFPNVTFSAKGGKIDTSKL
eukprot:534629_1